MIEILIILVVVGVCLYMVNTYIPMAAPVKNVINVLVVLCLIIFLLNAFGITHFHPPVTRR